MLLTVIFWGLSWTLGKILVHLAPPMTIAFFRFLTALFFFLPLLYYKRRSFKFDNKSLFYFFTLGLTGIFGYGTLFLIGMKFTTAAQGSIIAGVNPISISLFAHIFHKERLSKRWQYTGFFVSFIGVVFVIGVQSILNFRLDYLIGNLIILLAMILWGLYSAIGKQCMKTNTPLETTTGAITAGVIMFGIGATFDRFWVLDVLENPTFWLGITLLGIFVTFFGFYFYLTAINEIGATNTAIFINLVPVFGTLISFLVLHENISWPFLIGLIFVVMGISIINFPLTELRKKYKQIQSVEIIE